MTSLRPFRDKGLLPALSLPFVIFLLMPGYHLARWDSLIYTLPLQKDVLSQWMSGTLPAWSSGLACGTPLLANLNAGVLYPLKVLLVFFPLQTGMKLYLLAHVLLAYIGAHRCFRQLGFRKEAALAGAACFAFGGYARSLWDTYNITTWAWIPWGLIGLLHLVSPDKKHSGHLLTVGTLCMMILGGDAQGAAGWAVVGFLFLLLHGIPASTWFKLAFCLVITVLICSPQLIPSWVQLQASYRAGDLPLAEAMERSYHPARLLDLVVPYAFGTHETWYAKTLFGETAQRLTPWTASIAITPLLFFLPVTIRLKDRTTVWMLVLAAGGLLLSFGTFLGPAVSVHRLPLLDGFRYPEKYLLWVSLSLAYLLAKGFHEFFANKATPTLTPHQRWAGLTILIGGMLCFLVAPASWVGPWEAKSRTLLIWGLALAPCLLCLRTSRPAKPALFLTCCLWGLVVHWYQEQPLAPIPDPTESPSALVQAIQNEMPLTSGQRFYSDLTSPGFPMPPWATGLSPEQADKLTGFFALAHNSPGLWDIPAASGFSPFETGAIHHYRDSYGGGLFHPNPTDPTFAHFLKKTAVGLLYTSGKRWERLTTRQRLTGKILSTWALPDGTTTVLVRLKAEPFATLSGSDRHPAVLSLRRLEESQLDLKLKPADAAILHVSEAWAPGWTAVNSRNERLLLDQSPEGFMTVRLPAQTTFVRLNYTPPGLHIGWVGCVIGLALLHGVQEHHRYLYKGQAT